MTIRSVSVTDAPDRRREQRDGSAPAAATRAELVWQLAAARVQRVKELAAEGMSKTVIADHLGISAERVRQICEKHQIETLLGRKDWDALDALSDAAARGLTLTEAIQETGMTRSKAYDTARSNNISFAPEPRRWHEIRDAAAAGLTLSECARQMGSSVQSVWNQAKEHGIVFTAKEKPGGFSRARPICIEGRVYRAQVEAARAEGVTPQTIMNWINSGKAVRL